MFNSLNYLDFFFYLCLFQYLLALIICHIYTVLKLTLMLCLIDIEISNNFYILYFQVMLGLSFLLINMQKIFETNSDIFSAHWQK